MFCLPDAVRIIIDNGRRDPHGNKHSGNDRAEITIARDDDREIRSRGEFLTVILLIIKPPGPALEPLGRELHQDRCRSHRAGDSHCENGGPRVREHALPLGEGEDDEREFTALGERDREIHFVRDALQPHREGQDEKHPGLHNQEDRKSEDHFHRLRHDEMHVDTHADGHEEETEKELLKGRNLGFQLVPETRAAEKQTADKAAHGGREPCGLHDPGGADREEQREGREHLTRAATDREPEEGHSEESADTHHEDKGDRGADQRVNRAGVCRAV